MPLDNKHDCIHCPFGPKHSDRCSNVWIKQPGGEFESCISEHSDENRFALGVIVIGSLSRIEMIELLCEHGLKINCANERRSKNDRVLLVDDSSELTHLSRLISRGIGLHDFKLPAIEWDEPADKRKFRELHNHHTRQAQSAAKRRVAKNLPCLRK